MSEEIVDAIVEFCKHIEMDWGWLYCEALHRNGKMEYSDIIDQWTAHDVVREVMAMPPGNTISGVSK